MADDDSDTITVPDWAIGALAAPTDNRQDPWTNTMRPPYQPPAGTAFAPKPDPLDPRQPQNYGAVGNFYDPVLTPVGKELATSFLPGGPAATGINAVFGKGPALYRMGMLAAGLAAEPSDAEAGVGNKIFKYGGDIPKLAEDLWHGFSGIRTGNVRDTDLMKHAIEGAPSYDRPLITPADLQGKEIIFTPGDRTAAGGTLTSVGGRALRDPQVLQGGADYPFWVQQLVDSGQLDPASAKRVWANAGPQSTGFVNIGKDVLDRGRDPVLMYMSMGKQALDSSAQATNVALDLAKRNRITPEAIAELNATMAGAKNATFPGWETSYKDLRAWANDPATTGTERGRLLKAMDLGTAREGGFPDLGQIRYAMTDPRLRDVPTGAAGLTVSRFDPLAGVEKASGHGTYPTAILGSDVGTMGQSIPWHIAAPDIHDALMAMRDKAGNLNPIKFAERPDYYAAGKLPENFKTQVAHQRWVDMNSQYLEDVASGKIPPLGSILKGD